MKCTKSCVCGPMGCIVCVLNKNFRCDFIAQTCPLIAPVQPILHRVSCSKETLPNAPTLRNASKHEFRVQWGGLGAFVVKNSDATLWHKLVHWLHQFNPFCTKFCVVTKHWQMHPNTTKHTKTCVLGPMGWIGCVRCEEFLMRLHSTNLSINCTSSTYFAPSFV